MPKIGSFDTDSDALKKRVESHDRFGTRDLNDWIFENLDLSPRLSVLDLGCGFGKQSTSMLQQECDVVAVDASSASIDRLEASAEKLPGTLQTINSDFDSLILPDTEFDRVVSSFAFYYSQDAGSVLDKVSLKMKKGAIMFICGPAFVNNQGMKDFLGKAGVTFGEGSAPFMEKDGPALFSSHFGNVEKCYFENEIVFPNADEVWKYWSSHNMFDKTIEEQFKSNLVEHFDEFDQFVTKKVAIGLKSIKS